MNTEAEKKAALTQEQIMEESRDFARALIRAAEESGKPVEYWESMTLLISGAMGGHVGHAAARDSHHLAIAASQIHERETQPNTDQQALAAGSNAWFEVFRDYSNRAEESGDTTAFYLGLINTVAGTAYGQCGYEDTQWILRQALLNGAQQHRNDRRSQH